MIKKIIDLSSWEFSEETAEAQRLGGGIKVLEKRLKEVADGDELVTIMSDGKLLCVLAPLSRVSIEIK